MKATVLLADSGQADSSGKVHVLGLGWTVTDAPTTQPMAVVVLVTFDEPQDVVVGPHEIVMRLVAESGEPVELPDTGEPMVLKAEVNLERRPDTGPDGIVSAPLLVNIGPGLPLKPGQRYRWEAVIDGRDEQRVEASFVTREAAPAA